MNRLDAPVWKSNDNLLSVFSALKNKAKFVGGCVRDSILGIPFHDIDLATAFKPYSIRMHLESNGFKTLSSGYIYGTITAVLNDPLFSNVDITTLRQDFNQNGRYAKVIYTQDWNKDALRRDLTINAIYADFDGSIFDPCDGIADLKAGIVRFIGDPNDRIKEDYLRLVRFFRFYACFGVPPPNKEILNACATHKEGLKKLSLERTKTEIFKLIRSINPVNSMALMSELGILPYFFDTPPDLDSFKRFILLCPKASILYRFVSLLAFDVQALKDFAHRWQLPIQDLRLMQNALNTPVDKRPQDFTQTDCLTFIDFFGLETALIVACLLEAKTPNVGWKNVHTRIQQIPPIAFPVTGKDLISIGMQEGVLIQETLNILKKMWIDSNATLDQEALLNTLKN